MRLLFSVILGIVFPFVCFMSIGITTDYMQPSWLTEIKMFGQSAPGILLAPFSVPIYFNIFVKHHRIFLFIFDSLLFRAASLILFNWAIYGLIFYYLSGFLPRFKKQKISYSETPPSPPEF